MATTMLPVRSVGVMASAVPGHRKSDVNNRKSSSPNWWSPLFGVSGEPDYFDSDSNKSGNPGEMDQDAAKPSAKPQITTARGSFTAEKARQLRKLTTESSTFHDVMYHSAIASRLASDFSDR